MSNIERLSLKS